MFAKNFEQILQNLELDDIVCLKGKHINFQGNVVKIDEESGNFEVYVTHSNDQEAIGETIPITDEALHAVFESLEVKRYQRTREHYLTLIDLSLAIKNKDLFEYSCNKLNEFDMREKFIKSRTIM